MRRFIEFISDRSGTTPIEWGLLAVIVSVSALASIGGLPV